MEPLIPLILIGIAFIALYWISSRGKDPERTVAPSSPSVNEAPPVETSAAPQVDDRHIVFVFKLGDSGRRDAVKEVPGDQEILLGRERPGLPHVRFVKLPAKDVSRKHALIRYDEDLGGFTIRCHPESSSRTYLEGMALERGREVRIEDGASLRFGDHTRVVFRRAELWRREQGAGSGWDEFDD